MKMPSFQTRQELAARIDQHHQQLDEAMPYLEERGISRETAERFKLGKDGTRLTIPYLTPAGPWHIKRRCINPAHHDSGEHVVKECPKYSYDTGSDQHLFNASTLIAARSVVIVEGELDAITCEQHGIPAVGFPGADAWNANKHWRHVFDSTDEIVVIADGDPPEKNPKNKGLTPGDSKWVSRGVGEYAAAGVCQSLRNSVAADVKVVVLPVGMDANSYINTYGEQEMLAEIGWLT